MTDKEDAITFAFFAYKVLAGESKYRGIMLFTAAKALCETFAGKRMFHVPDFEGEKGVFAAKTFEEGKQGRRKLMSHHWVDLLERGKAEFAPPVWTENLEEFIKWIIASARKKRKRYAFTVVSSPANAGSITHYLGVVIDTKEKAIYTFDPAAEMTVDGLDAGWLEAQIITMALREISNNIDFQYRHLFPETKCQYDKDVKDAWCQTWSLFFQMQFMCELDPDRTVTRFNVSRRHNRENLMRFIKHSVNDKRLIQVLQAEYEAQVGLVRDDNRLEKFNAATLIKQAKFDHFFEPV